MKALETTAPTGETINYQIRNILGFRFIKVKVLNFDAIVHLNLAHYYFQSIPGVISIWSISLNADKTGAYYFGLTQNCTNENVMLGIAHEFELYFSSLKNHF
ncbi:MAG: hypothetical protein WCJ61_09020 [Paludibacter sp.]